MSAFSAGYSQYAGMKPEYRPTGCISSTHITDTWYAYRAVVLAKDVFVVFPFRLENEKQEKEGKGGRGEAVNMEN